jgi:hypothetical protein
MYWIKKWLLIKWHINQMVGLPINKMFNSFWCLVNDQNPSKCKDCKIYPVFTHLFPFE